MNAEQKKIALECIRLWGSEDLSDCAGDQMSALLQELVDAPADVLTTTNQAQTSSSQVEAPESEPVARVTGYYAGYLSIATVDGRVLPAGTALYAAPPHQSEHHLEMVNTPAPSVPDGHVYVYVSGLTGSGKSAVAGEIEIAMRAIGLDVEWVDSESEKHLTHADYTSALELYRPKVRIFEKNISRTAPPAPSVPGWQGWAMRLIDFIEGAEVSSGMCCCGDDMARHASPINCGHSPVDMWDNCVKNLRAEFDKFVAAAPTPAEAPADVARDARLQVESEFAALLPGVVYMDEPDGGSPTVQEQIKRMALDAARYRWLRTHGLQRAWVSLGTDFEGDNFASFRCEFNLPEPPNLPYEDDEGLQWADKDFDAAIDAALAAEKGGAK